MIKQFFNHLFIKYKVVNILANILSEETNLLNKTNSTFLTFQKNIQRIKICIVTILLCKSNLPALLRLLLIFLVRHKSRLCV